MEIIKYPNEKEFQKAVNDDEPLLVLVSFDGERLIVCQIDEAVEYHILFKKTGFPDTDTDKYFRLVVDKSGADWTFVCPESYSSITGKDKKFRNSLRMV